MDPYLDGSGGGVELGRLGCDVCRFLGRGTDYRASTRRLHLFRHHSRAIHAPVRRREYRALRSRNQVGRCADYAEALMLTAKAEVCLRGPRLLSFISQLRLIFL